MVTDDFAEGLNAKVVGRQQPDGSWLCACGQSCATDFDLYMHRRHHDHKDDE